MSLRPLEGVRVLDLCRLIPGALATRRLADLGADVVKVEEPGRGDYLRSIPPIVNGVGLMHAVLNRGKRSIEIDLKQPTGRARLAELAEVADVIVEVSRPGRFRAIGVDFDGLRRRRPALVVCSITGYGQNGPLADLPSHGKNMDAWAGCESVRWEGSRPRLGGGEIAISVELGGVNAALGITAALFQARATGVGEWLDISCWDAGVEANRLALAHLSATGEPMMAIADIGPLYDTYLTSDDRVVMFAAIEAKFWDSFCRGIGREDLLDLWSGQDVAFGENEKLAVALTDVFRTATGEEWAARFAAWGVPGSLVLGVDQLLSHPHLLARGLISSSEGSEIPAIASPIRSLLSGTRAESGRDAPELGANTDEVIADWLDRT